jgi:hypothetical protein
LSQSSLADFSARAFQAIIKKFGSSLSRAEPGLTPSLKKTQHGVSFLPRYFSDSQHIKPKTTTTTMIVHRKKLKTFVISLILAYLGLTLVYWHLCLKVDYFKEKFVKKKLLDEKTILMWTRIQGKWDWSTSLTESQWVKSTSKSPNF